LHADSELKQTQLWFAENNGPIYYILQSGADETQVWALAQWRESNGNAPSQRRRRTTESQQRRERCVLTVATFNADDLPAPLAYTKSSLNAERQRQETPAALVAFKHLQITPFNPDRRRRRLGAFHRLREFPASLVYDLAALLRSHVQYVQRERRSIFFVRKRSIDTGMYLIVTCCTGKLPNTHYHNLGTVS